MIPTNDTTTKNYSWTAAPNTKQSSDTKVPNRLLPDSTNSSASPVLNNSTGLNRPANLTVPKSSSSPSGSTLNSNAANQKRNRVK